MHLFSPHKIDLPYATAAVYLLLASPELTRNYMQASADAGRKAGGVVRKLFRLQVCCSMSAGKVGPVVEKTSLRGSSAQKRIQNVDATLHV